MKSLNLTFTKQKKTFFVFTGVLLLFFSFNPLIHPAYGYQECTNANSYCAGVVGKTLELVEVTVLPGGGYSCKDLGKSCSSTSGTGKGAVGSACGATGQGHCSATQTGSNCGSNGGGVCGSLYCCDTSNGSTTVTKTTSGGSSSSSSSSSSSNSANNGGGANNLTGNCPSAGDFCNMNHAGYTVDSSHDGNALMSCSGPGATASLKNQCTTGCHIDPNPGNPDTCESAVKTSVKVPSQAGSSSVINSSTITCDHPENTGSQQNGFKDESTGNHSYCAAYQYCTGAGVGMGRCTGKTCKYTSTSLGNASPGVCASLNSTCSGGMDINTCDSGKCCSAGSASLLVLGTSTIAPVDTVLTAQMNAYADSTATNLLAQSKKTNDSHVLAATTYSATDKLNYDNKADAFTYSNNNFNVNAIPSGKYKLYMHIDRYLNKTIVDIAGNNSFSFPTASKLVTPVLNLIPGDAAPLPHGDNYIDIQDYNYVLECQGLKTTQKSATCPDAAMADMDENGIIDARDLQRVRDHFGESGDSPFPPQFTCVTDPSCVSGNNTIQACALKCSVTTPN